MNILERIEATSARTLSLIMFVFTFVIMFVFIYFMNTDGLLIIPIIGGMVIASCIGIVTYVGGKEAEYNKEFFKEYDDMVLLLRTIQTKEDLDIFIQSDEYQNLCQMKGRSGRYLDLLKIEILTLQRVLK